MSGGRQADGLRTLGWKPAQGVAEEDIQTRAEDLRGLLRELTTLKDSRGRGESVDL